MNCFTDNAKLLSFPSLFYLPFPVHCTGLDTFVRGRSINSASLDVRFTTTNNLYPSIFGRRHKTALISLTRKRHADSGFAYRTPRRLRSESRLGGGSHYCLPGQRHRAVRTQFPYNGPCRTSPFFLPSVAPSLRFSGIHKREKPSPSIPSIPPNRRPFKPLFLTYRPPPTLTPPSLAGQLPAYSPAFALFLSVFRPD